MPRKQRVSEEEEVPLAPEVSPPPVAYARERQHFGRLGEVPVIPDRAPPQEEPPLPTLTGFGITDKLTKTGWVAYRCTTGGEVDILTPRRADGTLEGEKKHSASARMLAAITEAYS